MGFALSSLLFAHPYFVHPYFGNVLALGLYLTQKITPWSPLSFWFFVLFFPLLKIKIKISISV
jgi:hypothetical protein